MRKTLAVSVKPAAEFVFLERKVVVNLVSQACASRVVCAVWRHLLGQALRENSKKHIDLGRSAGVLLPSS